MKELALDQAEVPTARYATFTRSSRRWPLPRVPRHAAGPYVIKTDGLAAGKGVVVTADAGRSRAGRARVPLGGRRSVMPARRCVIEEGLTGPELSVFAICDGTRAVLCGSAQDHKRVGDGDTGPNTGGMGAYSPVPVAYPDVTWRSEILHDGRSSPRSHALTANAASTTEVSCSAGSCSRPRVGVSWSTTSASAIPRRRWCSRDSTSDLAAVLRRSRGRRPPHRRWCSPSPTHAMVLRRPVGERGLPRSAPHR